MMLVISFCTLITAFLQAALISCQPSTNDTCPEECQCLLTILSDNTPQRTVDCAKKKLHSIPKDVSINTEALLLQENAIRSLPEHLSLLTSIKTLNLANNRIASLGPPSLLENLTSLHSLDLEHNNVEMLLHGSFTGLASLQELSLANNQIGAIESYAFEGADNLHMLSLEGNRLPELQHEWFANLPSLQFLSLARNQLHSINEPVFQALNSLTNLSLSGNLLNSLSADAFSGLAKLKQLDLSSNAFTHVNTAAFRVFDALNVLVFSHNPLDMLPRKAFSSLEIGEIHMSYMPELSLLDAGAFYDLPSLTVIDMHDNAKLSFIDPLAFVQVDSLEMLHLHNNNLRALPSSLLSELPNLQVVSFYNNPLQCDCNSRWIKVTEDGRADNSTGINFINYDKFICHSPEELRGKLFKSLSLTKFAKVCSPSVIPFFNDSYQLELGQNIEYVCRAIGIPIPKIHWIMPDGKILNGTSNYSRVKLQSTGTLSIEHLKATDGGKYTCVASSSGGTNYDTATSVLRLHNKDIQILDKGVATNFITVTWNGTGSTISTSDYFIMFKQKDAESEYHMIDLRPYMRTYTITNLKPHTVYEFCIAFRHQDAYQKLNCVDIQTKHQMFLMTGIRTMGNLSIFIAIVIITCMMCFLCAATMIIKKCIRRKSYQEPEGANVPAKVGNLSQIPLDNIYHPPSTPLFASTTSLIPSSSA